MKRDAKCSPYFHKSEAVVMRSPMLQPIKATRKRPRRPGPAHLLHSAPLQHRRLQRLTGETALLRLRVYRLDAELYCCC